MKPKIFHFIEFMFINVNNIVMFRRLATSLLSIGLLSGFLCPTVGWGYLGSFEEQDGYRIPLDGLILSGFLAGDAQFYLNNIEANGYTGVVPLGAYPNTLGDSTHGVDLSRYNAGQYGTNNGGPGGTASDIIDNSGLWQALAGGRLNEDADAPYYNGTNFTRDYVQAYRYPGARTGSSVLNFLASETSLSYAYSFDSRDFNGMSPSASNGQLIQMAFWLCPSDWDDDDQGNIMSISLRDSMGQTVFQVGYTGDNMLQYQTPRNGFWETTSHRMGTLGWSQLVVILDTVNNTAGIAVRAFDDNTFTLEDQSYVLSNRSLGLEVNALTGLQWDLRGGPLNNGAASFKNYFDDFSFTLSPVIVVPEPGSLLLTFLASMLLMRRSRNARARG
jgi:hypothetical protein